MYNWKFDDIDFDDYGVRIRGSRGILDIPKLQLDGYDWLDQHGKEYWQSVGDLKYAEREIIIDCFISSREGMESTAYEEFLDKISAFFTAISAEGQHTLTTPYGIITDVTIQEGLTVDPKFKYVKSVQVGLFSLRLTVKGDSQLQYFSIIAAAGEPVVAIIGTKNMQVHRTLQGESYATCSFEVNVPIAANMYDYVLINTNGVTNEPYYLFQKPEFKKVSSNKLVYNLKLEHGSSLLKNSQFLAGDGSADFYLYADLETIIDKVVTNSQRFIADKFRKGTVGTGGTLCKNHKFSGENCYDVVKRMAQEYELEYDIRFGEIGPRYTINLVKQIATTKEITLEYGKGNELYDLSRQPINRDDLCTVLYAYGAAKNLKPDYRGGKQRLEFTGNPRTQNVSLYMGVEKTVFFDDIFPQRTAEVTAYEQILKCEEGDPGWTAYKAIKEVWPGGLYKVTDSTLDFDLNEYLLGGLAAKLRMKTGDLAGYEFEIDKYDHTLKAMFIIPFKDERGKQYPNEDLMIAAEDEYTLVDIDQPETYVTAAESQLSDAADDYLQEHSVPQYPYNCTLQPGYVRNLVNKFEVGDRLTVSDADAGINQLYRISALSYNCYTGIVDLTLSEHRMYSVRERVNLRLNNVERFVKDTAKDTVESMRKEKETATEIRNRIFSPADDLQDTDKTIRNESIDPRMLGYDAGVPQFSIKGLLVETHYNGDENAVHVGVGQVIISNWAAYTFNRYEISKDRELYNPTRTWEIQETDITLETGKGYFLYVKLPVDDIMTLGTLETQEEHVEAKRYIEDGFIYYKLGYINIAQSPRTAAMLWGNFKSEPDPRAYGGGTPVYLHTEDRGITGYKKAMFIEPDAAMTTYTATSNNSNEVLIKSFATDANFPGAVLIKNGPWIFQHWVAVNTSDRSSLVIRVYKRTVGNVETELFNLSHAVTAVGAALSMKVIINSQFELIETDILVFKYYHKCASSTNRTMYLFIEGNSTGAYTWSNIRIPIEPLGKDIKVKYNVDDPTAGFLADKIVAGNLITGEEGTGANENKVKISAEFEQAQSDWNQVDNEEPDYIKNKPTIPDDYEYWTLISKREIATAKYGNLYNWWAATDSRNMTPRGWHVPSVAEWTTLITSLGGESIAGGKAKETGLTYWNDPNSGADNSSLFNGRGHGQRTSNTGAFGAIKQYGQFWATNEGQPSTDGRIVRLNYNTSYFNYTSGLSLDKKCGIAVRWIKDDSNDLGEVTGNDGKIYTTVKIGTQVWTACNVMETKYRNGNSISGPTYTDAAWAALTTEAYCQYSNDSANGGTTSNGDISVNVYSHDIVEFAGDGAKVTVEEISETRKKVTIKL